VLPLKWRAAVSLYGQGSADLGTGDGWGWLWMQDKSAFSQGGTNFGSDYITVLDLKRGLFHYNEGDADYGIIFLEAQDRKIKLYIAADFSAALPRRVYKTSTITIGLFNE
jgi:hypothetical protein